MDSPKPDLGRFIVYRPRRGPGAFKTPTLREVEHTAPYMHDGRFRTLEEVVEHYDKGGIPNPYLDRRIKPLHLTAAGQEGPRRLPQVPQRRRVAGDQAAGGISLRFKPHAETGMLDGR